MNEIDWRKRMTMRKSWNVMQLAGRPIQSLRRGTAIYCRGCGEVNTNDVASSHLIASSVAMGLF
eukprot:scaffold11936_cov182-Ochromonas_danica.AAC.1